MGRGVIGMMRDFNTFMYFGRNLERLNRKTWEITVSHSGLGKTRVIRGTDKEYVLRQANAQGVTWDGMWARQVASEQNKAAIGNERAAKATERDARIRLLKTESDRRTAQREAHDSHVASQIEDAENRTRESANRRSEAQRLLLDALEGNLALDWESLKPDRTYPDARPRFEALPDLAELPPKPLRSNDRYSIPYLLKMGLVTTPPPAPKRKEVGLLGRLAGGEQRAELEYLSAKSNWDSELHALYEDAKLFADQRFAADLDAWNSLDQVRQAELDGRQRLQASQSEQLNTWEKKKAKWCTEIDEAQLQVDQFRSQYEAKDVDAIANYCDQVLRRSKMPDWLDNEWDIHYEPDKSIVILGYRLPNIESLPNFSTFKYSERTDAIAEKLLSKSDSDGLYDSIVFQLALKSLYELFQSDYIDAIVCARFNGYVRKPNKATGLEEVNYIISARADKASFMQMNLRAVDAKACFQGLPDSSRGDPHQFRIVQLTDYVTSG